MSSAERPPAGPRRIGHFIGGREEAGRGRFADVRDPATGEVNGRVAMADAAAVDRAVEAARAAFPAWRDTPPRRRAQVLHRFRGLLEENADGICALITAEHGKTPADARGELGRGIEVVEYACGVEELLKGEFSRDAGPGIDSWSEFRPLGVMAGITPFNFPAMVPMWMFPLAVACGNTFVLKPSELDPGAPMLIARLFSDAGLPDGVLNVVNGDRGAAERILADPRVRAVSFVGSTAAAESVYRAGAAAGKRVQALGGAKNHAVIMPDADLDAAADALMGAAYGSCGERCMAVSVAACVGDGVADALVERLRGRIGALRVGPGDEAGVDMGPLISAEALERVRRYIEEGLDQGAELVVDGRGLKVPGREGGFFLGACLFDRVTEAMSVHRDEIFGPVLCLARVSSLDEAMGLVNRHEYGNGACIFTRDGAAARRFTDGVEAGMVGVNAALPVPVASQSFGGWKRSLFGGLCAYGPDAVRFCTRRKTMTQRWPAGGDADGAGYAFPGGYRA